MIILPQIPLICKDIRGRVKSKTNGSVWAIYIRSFFAYSEKTSWQREMDIVISNMQRRAEKAFLLVTSPQLEYILYLWSILVGALSPGAALDWPTSCPTRRPCPSWGLGHGPKELDGLSCMHLLPRWGGTTQTILVVLEGENHAKENWVVVHTGQNRHLTIPRNFSPN